MDDGYWPLSILMLLGFILADALLYGFGAALQNMNQNNLEKAAEEGSERAGRLLALVEKPAEFINTVQVMTNLIGIVTGAYLLKQFGHLFYRLAGMAQTGQEKLFYGVSLVAAAILLTAVLISFGIVIPKKCGARNPEKWGYGTYPAVRLAVVVMKPFTLLVSGLSAIVLKPMGIDVNSAEDNVTEEDIMLMVNEGHEQGILEADEAEMITNIFEMNDKAAGDIMTHRTNISALDVSMTLDEAVTFILKEANNSRFPVYEKDIDDIVGILHMRDALNWAEQDENREKRLSELDGLLREAHFIPETRHIDTLFKEMQSQKIHMEIVVDEYGQTAGIVTMEDILEEIVGNILDEYDEDEDFISLREDGTVLFDGMTPLEDVSEALGIEFEEEDLENYDTLNGFLISRLDRIPKEGEQPELEYRGYLFRVLSVENKILHKVMAVKQMITSEAAKEAHEEK
ncbi:MAG: hemolysin family protein [Clostridium sp.]|nr:hemolysin family protein [Clostridiaceae bacterium]MDY5483555.1 hemolysin family protein [Clostridium sp.]